MKKTMFNTLKCELNKIRNNSFYNVVYVNEIDEVRHRFRIAKVRFRTEPIIKNNNIIAYKVYTL